MSEWRPDRTVLTLDRPTVGSLIAHQHAVWRVVGVYDLPLSEDDRLVWLREGMPELDSWRKRPYRLEVDHLGGMFPDWATQDGVIHARIDVPALSVVEWYVYVGSRWPMCSCCGEPVPCRAELQDRDIAMMMRRVDKLSRRQPGNCWACEEPVTHRQKSITYRGENLDLPGGPTVVFHLRRNCWASAHSYELRWIAQDPRNERILTYPRCHGLLLVHADGSSECRSGVISPLGATLVGESNCGGHVTHDHGSTAACYVGDNWLGDYEGARCPRGCTPEGHPGTRTSPRPSRSQSALVWP